ncbi:MAG: cyclodeaminase/cyclohydrolase family protein [Synergistaceae bacterium]|jgi:glutamate formiminotransferase/formiminotetrahydrofolate cyclodeaminase|nr:cyclodeaminase/cyclohydrolase family protein [Synergistaceae bacterium]
MAFFEEKIEKFLGELASDAPAPGGGSVAALGGALSAALVSMVANLTVGKEKYKDNWAAMAGVRERSEHLRTEFARLADEDTESFNVFMAAMKMPRDTDEKKASRKKAMEEASKGATEIPLRTLESCARASEVALDAAKLGNPNAASDAGSAALFAEAAGRAAAYNVRINLPGISDEAFAAQARERMSKALSSIDDLSRETEKVMDGLLG